MEQAPQTHVSVTRLRLKSVLYVIQMIYWTLRVSAQARHSHGFCCGRLLMDRDRAFWTLTVWKSETAMRRFRDTGAHRRVMPRLDVWCDEAAFAHWLQWGMAAPPWPEVRDHLVQTGQSALLRDPSARQETRDYPAPRFNPRVELVLHPPRTSPQPSKPEGGESDGDADPGQRAENAR